MLRLIEHAATEPDEETLEKRKRVAANYEIYEVGRPSLGDVPAAAEEWVGHVGWLASLADGGCSFRMDDLEPEEWEGLRLWREAQRRFSERWKQCPGCGKPIRSGAKFHNTPECGWEQ